MIAGEYCMSKIKKNKCKCLVLDICIGDRCRFKKTDEDNKKAIRYSYERISKMDKLMHIYISEKYYKGKMPWKEGGTSL